MVFFIIFLFLYTADYPQIHFQDDDIFLAKYLRCVDWDVAVAFKRIHNVYKLKVHIITKIGFLRTTFASF